MVWPLWFEFSDLFWIYLTFDFIDISMQAGWNCPGSVFLLFIIIISVALRLAPILPGHFRLRPWGRWWRVIWSLVFKVLNWWNIVIIMKIHSSNLLINRYAASPVFDANNKRVDNGTDYAFSLCKTLSFLNDFYDLHAFSRLLNIRFYSLISLSYFYNSNSF
jgi:hypothetical protein